MLDLPPGSSSLSRNTQPLCPAGALRTIFQAGPFSAAEPEVLFLSRCCQPVSHQLQAASSLLHVWASTHPHVRAGTFICRAECPAWQAPGCLAGPDCDVCSLAPLPCAFRDPALGRGGVSPFILISYSSIGCPRHFLLARTYGLVGVIAKFSFPLGTALFAAFMMAQARSGL